MALVPSAGGALLPYQKQEFKTDVKIDGNLTVVGTISGTGSSGLFASPAITGTVTGGASYTAPTLTSPTITGTTTIGAGCTLTTPVIGAATGTSVVLSGDCKAATFHAGSTAGVTAGPFTTVGSINVIAGLVTTLTGS